MSVDCKPTRCRLANPADIYYDRVVEILSCGDPLDPRSSVAVLLPDATARTGNVRQIFDVIFIDPVTGDDLNNPWLYPGGTISAVCLAGGLAKPWGGANPSRTYSQEELVKAATQFVAFKQRIAATPPPELRARPPSPAPCPRCKQTASVRPHGAFWVCTVCKVRFQAKGPHGQEKTEAPSAAAPTKPGRKSSGSAGAPAGGKTPPARRAPPVPTIPGPRRGDPAPALDAEDAAEGDSEGAQRPAHGKRVVIVRRRPR